MEEVVGTTKLRKEVDDSAGRFAAAATIWSGSRGAAPHQRLGGPRRWPLDPAETGRDPEERWVRGKRRAAAVEDLGDGVGQAAAAAAAEARDS